MLSWETTKKLKDKGFPVSQVMGGEEWKGEKVYFDGTKSESGKKIGFLIPTLSQLIDACGNQFAYLRAMENDWHAAGERPYDGADSPDGEHCGGDGATYEEAVANLWLDLNKYADSL